MKLFNVLFLALLVVVSLIIGGCSSGKAKPVNSANSVRVTDFRNKEISLSKPAERIVCLIESGLSGLYMLGAQNHVVGVSSAVYNESTFIHYAEMDERIRNKQLPAPGNWDFVSIENIVALQPDLVIIWASQTESIKSIEGHGIPVYAVFLTSFASVYKEIQDFGTLTGTRQRADSLISYTKSEINKLKIRNQPNISNLPSVYFMWPQGLLETAGSNSIVNELIELAGAKNSCVINQEHVVINKEMLLDWNPDILLMWYNASLNPADIILLPEIQQLKAVQNKKVYELPSVFMCDLWTLKFPFAAKMLAKWAYPTMFSNLNLEDEKHEMLFKLYGANGEKLLR